MQKDSLVMLSSIYHVHERLFARLLKNDGLNHFSPAQGRILMALWEQDNIPVRQLAERTSLDKSTLSLSLTRMEREEILEREGDRTDRRVVRVRLTKKGESVCQQCEAVAQRLKERVFDGIPTEEVEAFDRVLNGLLIHLNREEQKNNLSS